MCITYYIYIYIIVFLKNLLYLKESSDEWNESAQGSKIRGGFYTGRSKSNMFADSKTASAVP